MDLLHKQYIFSGLVARLILYAYQQGYKVTLGEAWRSPETCELYEKEGKGIRNSLHNDRLAIDLNLFKNDDYLIDSAQYIVLGEFWEGLSDVPMGIKCIWGGSFAKPDGNHFSIEHRGVK